MAQKQQSFQTEFSDLTTTLLREGKCEARSHYKNAIFASSFCWQAQPDILGIIHRLLSRASINSYAPRLPNWPMF